MANLDRYRFHGDKCVGRVVVADCSRRRPAGDVDAVDFAGRFRKAVDEILALLRRPARTLAQDNQLEHDAIRKLNERNAEFWKGRVS